MNWFYKLFNIKLPKAGETWVFKDSYEGPWPNKTWTVKILDFKEGWVRYSIGNIFNDERKELKMFLLMYKFENKEIKL